MADKRDQHRTLEDDCAALEIDAEDGSPRVEGEGAALAEDAVADQPHGRDVVVPRHCSARADGNASDLTSRQTL